jgi:hypothetical protein
MLARSFKPWQKQTPHARAGAARTGHRPAGNQMNSAAISSGRTANRSGLSDDDDNVILDFSRIHKKALGSKVGPEQRGAEKPEMRDYEPLSSKCSCSKTHPWHPPVF